MVRQVPDQPEREQAAASGSSEHHNSGAAPAAPKGSPGAALAIGGLLLGCVVAFGFYLADLAPAKPRDFGKAATLLPTPRPVDPFDLVDHNQSRFDRGRLMGRWSLFFFGYTYCPDICPTTLQTLGRVNAHWKAAIPAREPSATSDALPPQVVFVSVDPERDSPGRMGEYIGYFDDSFVGATGSQEQLGILTRSLGVFYEKVEPEADAEGRTSASDYLIGHSANLFLVDPEGRLHAVLDDPHDPEEFADLVMEIQRLGRDS